MSVRCPFCNAVIDMDPDCKTKFCPECGTKLNTEQTEAPVQAENFGYDQYKEMLNFIISECKTFLQNNGLYNGMFNNFINFTRSNQPLINDNEMTSYVRMKFSDLERLLVFDDSITVSNWEALCNAVDDILPKMMACVIFDLNLGRRMAVASNAVYNVLKGPWMSMFRPKEIRSIDVRTMAPVIARAKAIYSWTSTFM